MKCMAKLNVGANDARENASTCEDVSAAGTAETVSTTGKLVEGIDVGMSIGTALDGDSWFSFAGTLLGGFGKGRAVGLVTWSAVAGVSAPEKGDNNAKSLTRVGPEVGARVAGAVIGAFV